MSWNSWSHPYRKLRKLTGSLTTVTGNGPTWMGGWKCRRVVTTRHELTRLVTSKSRLDLSLSRKVLADKRNKTRSHAMYTSFYKTCADKWYVLTKCVCRKQNCASKQEAMQCIPRSRNVCRQVIRFNEMRVQEQNCASKQEAMQCIPRSRNACRQVIRFNEMRVQETKLYI